MKIVAKSKFNNNIYDKVIKGATAIELHLDEEFVLNPKHWDEQIVKDVPIIAVHAPLIADSDTDIEIFDNRQILVDTCNLARRIASEQGHKVTVICHLGMKPDILMSLRVYDNLVFFMRDLANTYEHLEFAVENTVCFDRQTCQYTGVIDFRAIDFDSSVQFVKDVNHPRVGTCLDTCHALIAIRAAEEIAQYVELDPSQYGVLLRDGMEAFFAANQHHIKWIHLANAKRHGLGEDHGLPFDLENIGDLEHILWLYYKYGYACPVSIEVREQDYANAVNFAKTRRTLKRLLLKNRLEYTQ